MRDPELSLHFQTRLPSSIRLAQIEFLKRTDGVEAINTAIGNVSLPMHPAMQKRMRELTPFQKGVVKYSTTVGEVETNQTFLHLIQASGFSTEGLYSQITDGGSQAMELVILGVCGPAGTSSKPLLFLEPIYSNYVSMAERVGRATVGITRQLDEEGHFKMPDLAEIEKVIEKEKPGALLVIPYDNPTGQFFPQKQLNELARLAVKHNLWLISDEAYREIFYTKDRASSIWGVTEKEVPGITGRRISIESASKVWNACGLRIGALVTDNGAFHRGSVAENTANLCANAIGQYIFASLLEETPEKLKAWFQKQRNYYSQMAKNLTRDLKKEMPKIIVSQADAALYTVVDVREMVGDDFDATEFVMYCAKRGRVDNTTLLVAPMEGFYTSPQLGKTQMRIAYVEPPESMKKVPYLLSELLQYKKKHG